MAILTTPAPMASTHSSFPSMPSLASQGAAPLLGSDGIPLIRISPDLVKKDPQPAESSSPFGATKSCAPNDSRPICQRPVSETNGTTLPIVLGVVLPLTVAMVMFAVLHRRHVRKLRREDANDKHKSLDFGMGDVEAPTSKRGKRPPKAGDPPQMSLADTEKTLSRRQHMLSMDMNMSIDSPYMLPPELHESRESLHSLSRTGNHEDDKYRNPASFLPGEGPRSQAGSRMGDDASSFTASTRHGMTDKETESNASLLRHAQRMSRSMPPTRKSSFSSTNSAPTLQFPQKARLGSSQSPSPPPMNRLAAEKSTTVIPPAPNHNLAPVASQKHRESYLSDISKDGNTVGLRKSNDYLGAFIRSGGATLSEPKARVDAEKAPPSPPKDKSLPNRESATLLRLEANAAPKDTPPPKRESATLLKLEANSPLKFDFPDFVKDPAKAPPHSAEPHREYPSQEAESHHEYPSQGAGPHPDYLPQATEPHREYIPPHRASDGDEPDHHHSGYDQELEYDERRLTMGMRPLPPDDDPTEDPEQRAIRIRSFYKEYFDESKHAHPPADDPSAGIENEDNQNYYDYTENYYGRTTPHAQPWTGRAMTPQPRGNAEFQPQHRMAASASGGHFVGYTGPRAFSSASGRFGGPPPGLPKKKGPPPAPLQVLPTPHLLKDDTMLPMDFAPPSSIRAQRSGTPDSLRGGRRPYSPALPAHLPLAGSYDDLAVMPSPHALRRSGTFTALDFAPPPRFRSDTDSRSDAGSIKSNRSGMSAAQIQSIRSGAYRVSRIPGELGGTKQEFDSSLKPSWDMRK